MNHYYKPFILFFLITLSHMAIGQIPYAECTNCPITENTSNANTIYNYGSTLLFTPWEVTSDYGPRRVSVYDWHNGIDFRPHPGTSDHDNHRGTAILSPETGNIEHLKITGGGYKYLVVDGTEHYGYGHIFNSTELDNTNMPTIVEGNFILKFADFPDNDVPCIFVKDDTNPKALSTESNMTLTIDSGASFDGSYATTTQVSTDEMIAPMGGSGGINSFPLNDIFPVHLHFYKFDSNPGNSVSHTNCKDASRELSINEQTTYTLETSTQSNNSGVTINYGLNGTGSRPKESAFKTRITMDNAISNGERFENVFMKVIKLEYRLTSELLNDQIIQGPYYNSNFDLDEIYPRVLQNDDRRGNWTRTGIDAFAYSGANPFDDWYFSDFNTRIHTDDQGGTLIGDGTRISNPIQITDTPENARYNDGEYNLSIVAIDTQDDEFDEAETFTLDNFQPFITRFAISDVDKEKYELFRTQSEGTATLNDGKLKNQLENIDNNPSGDTDFLIEISLSEPVKNLKVQWQVQGSGSWSPLLDLEEVDALNWDLVIDGSTFNDCMIFRVEGQDKSENELINVYEETNQNTLNIDVYIPTRKSLTGNDQWLRDPTHIGEDFFEFCFNQFCESEINLKAGQTSVKRIIVDCSDITEFTETVVVDCNGLTDIWLVGFDYEKYIIGWQDENGDYQIGEEYIFSAEPGEYCYRIESLDGCCSYENCIIVTGSETTFSSNITLTWLDGSMFDTKDLKVSLNDFSSLIAPVSVKLFESSTGNQIGGTGILNEITPNYYFDDLTIGKKYCLVFEEQFTGCTFEYCFMVEGQTCPEALNIEEVSIDNECEGSLGAISLSISAGDCPAYNVSWSNGMTGSEISGLVAGIYCAVIQGEDGCEDCITAQCFEVVEEEDCVTCNIYLDSEIIPRYACSEYDKFGNGISRIYPGSISLTVGGGSGNYTFEWLNTSGGNGPNATISWWDPSIQCVIISDQECDYSEEFCFEVGTLIYPEEYCKNKKKWFFVPQLEEWVEFNTADMYDEVLANLIKKQPQRIIRNGRWKYSFTNELDKPSYKLTMGEDPTVLEYISLESSGKDIRFDTRKESSSHVNQQSIEIKAYPNPFIDIVNLEVIAEVSEISTLNIYDKLGRRVYSKTIDLKKGMNEILLDDLSSLQSDLMIITLESKNGILGSTKIVKQ